LAEDAGSIGEGDVRLVAWTESEIPGVEIEPRASQQRHASLVVANLRTGLGPVPVHDVNTRAEVAKAADEELENWEPTPQDATP
jgi:hypothetical protein